MRYLIAIAIPDHISRQLQDIYQHTYQQPLTVRFIHTTLIPPFTLSDQDVFRFVLHHVQTLPDVPAPFRFGPAATFVNQRTILYLPLLSPTQPTLLADAYHQLYSSLQSRIDIQTSNFKHNRLPEFSPHVTLNYNFHGDPTAFIPPPQEFSLPKPQLLTERGPGLWEPAQSGQTP